MVTVTWYWNSGTEDTPTWTAFASGNLLKMTGGGYSDNVSLAEYQEYMHLQTSSSDDSDACVEPHLTNVKYTGSDEAIINRKYVSVLSATFPLAANCFKIVVTHTAAFTTTNGKLFFYNGTTPATAPSNMTVYGLEQTDTSWTSCGGSASAVSITDKATPATSQTFYVAVSTSPTTSGAKTATLRFSVDYNDGGGAVTTTSDVEINLIGAYCDEANPNHILAILAGTLNKPAIKEMTSSVTDNMYGDDTNPTFGTPRDIVGLVVTDSGYYGKDRKDIGIEVKATPALLVPIGCKYELGSRVYDPLTMFWYELAGESDIIRHFDEDLAVDLNYREYSLLKVQEATTEG